MRFFNPLKGLFKGCFKLNCQNSNSKLKLILKSDCLQYKNIVINLNTNNEDELEHLFEEIKRIITPMYNEPGSK
ncbi:MAG: hypothetical protein COB29_11420 [Sulfitobacter sp.]|nr:MAG: hypothetical protein COB29_11420 [Sulfitobacter sp.]